MVYPAYQSFSQSFATGSTEINMNIVKSSTRLSQMFFTFSNSSIQANGSAGNFAKKKWTWFFHSMAATIDNLEGVIDSDTQISYYEQIANKKFPEQPVESIAEAIYFLRRAVNVMSPYCDGFSIDIYPFANDKFIGGINFDGLLFENALLSAKSSTMTNIECSFLCSFFFWNSITLCCRFMTASNSSGL